ncbi:hypothetical protein BCR43DRAFT_71114 [Syncephalastrum racemosum]|uniref:Uncharacterized protein n=1 Tax=Syncephalastrum racemosum TaxID=13706 RepID=A0A1X2HWP2_SYNRA|nr:hypothetical protein BCR43DRAFT_71114 [Syncephalastrum racemosum]
MQARISATASRDLSATFRRATRLQGGRYIADIVERAQCCRSSPPLPGPRRRVVIEGRGSGPIAVVAVVTIILVRRGWRDVQDDLVDERRAACVLSVLYPPFYALVGSHLQVNALYLIVYESIGIQRVNLDQDERGIKS